MDKDKKLSVVFSVSYTVVIMLALLFFFVDILTGKTMDYRLMAIIVSGTLTYMVLNILIKDQPRNKDS
jgi:autotransporter translocation and assembly factor TamB